MIPLFFFSVFFFNFYGLQISHYDHDLVTTTT